MTDNDNFDLGRREALESQIRRVSVPLAAAAGWMKFVGVLTIAAAVASVVVSFWSLVFAWLPIWSSVLLYMAATRVAKAAATGQEDELVAALDRLRLYFLISGVLLLIAVILIVIGVASGVPLNLGV
jgi:hypothetical protein